MSDNGFKLLGFIALALFGEGLAQATYAQLLYTPFFLLCCFPIARIFGRRAEQKPLAALLLLENARDPRVWVPLLAIACGLGLNGAHVARPGFVSGLTRGLILLGTATSSCAIGLIFSGLHLRRFWRENLISQLHRCTLYPLFYWGLARAVGLNALDPAALVLYGLVPSALLANLLAVFFELDTDLTSSMFLVSTALFLAFVFRCSR